MNRKAVPYSSFILGLIALLLVGALVFSQLMFMRKTDLFLKKIAPISLKEIQIDSTNNLNYPKALLDLQKEQFKIELEKQKQELFWFNISFLGIGGVLGFLGLLFLLPKEIEKQAKKEVDEKIMDAIRGRSEDVRLMLQGYDQETFLRTQKRIYIKGLKNSDKIISLLRENGIPSANILTEEKEAADKGFHILFLNNIDGDLLQNPPHKSPDGTVDESRQVQHRSQLSALMELISSAPPSVCFFYYCEKGVNFPTWEISSYEQKKKFNFATNPAQIYGNLLNSLKYQDRLSNL